MRSDWQLDPRHSGSFARLETLLGKLHGFHALIVQHNNPTYRDGLIQRLHVGQMGSDILDLKPLDGFEVFETALTALAGNVSTLHVINLESWDETQRQAFFRGINYHREYIAHQLNATLVLWLVEPHIRAMALQAADFWAWREQVLDFALPLETQPRWEANYQNTTNLDQPAKRQRIQEILDYLATQQDEEPTLTIADMQHELGNLYEQLGEYDDAQQHLHTALAHFAQLDERHAYARVLMDKAYLRFQQGEPAEALDDLQTKVLPWFVKLNDLQQQAETQGRIADILQARGQLDDALNIWQDDVIPIFEKLGDVRSKAVTMGKIADILQARGQLDNALNIRQNHELPVYEKLGDVRSKAVTMGKIADILQARGQLDDALNIRQNHELPVYEKLGDVREKSLAMMKIAEILWQQDAAAHAETVRTYLCQALHNFQTMQMPREIKWVQDKFKITGLPCEGTISPKLFLPLHDGDVLYPEQYAHLFAPSIDDAQRQTTGLHRIDIPYLSANKHLTLWTGFHLPESQSHVQVDRRYFLDLLINSLSLDTPTEKMRVINSFPTLSQYQVDELTKVLTDEKTKFIELSKEYPGDTDKLQDKTVRQWLAWEETHQ